MSRNPKNGYPNRTRFQRDALIHALKLRLQSGNNFFFGTDRPHFWRNIIERELTDCAVEDWDGGLVVRK